MLDSFPYGCSIGFLSFSLIYDDSEIIKDHCGSTTETCHDVIKSLVHCPSHCGSFDSCDLHKRRHLINIAYNTERVCFVCCSHQIKI
nr:MAG TPA: hypothetical protein [Caudoviricetes sp.]